MSENVIALNRNTHATLKVKVDASFKHAKNQHLCLLQAHEFTLAALEYPIVFIEDDNSGQFIAVAMLGLTSGENLFFSPSGWKGEYIPSNIIGYPLSMGIDNSVYIDMDSDLINTTEGEPLFTQEGEDGALVVHFKSIAQTFIAQSQETKAFIATLREKNLLQNLTLTINDPEKGSQNLTGIYSANIQALQQLPEQEFIEFKNKQYLAPIFAQSMSLNNISKLLKIKKTSSQ